MYFSRVMIDWENRQKSRDLSHLGAYHNWVETCFPEEFSKKERSRKLWRVDRLQGKDYLLIVSETKPDRQAMEKYGVAGTAESKNYDPFLASLSQGEQAMFRVTLNPVKSICPVGTRRGRVVPLANAVQENFLLDRAEKLGFQIQPSNFQIVERGAEPFKKKGQRDMKLKKAVYEGKLTILDADKMRKTLTEGIGKKKAYGFGLMTLIPIKDHEK